tara:strand:- start:455 stop:835 length:381 start_codon:yes stop_codon:yes gene_type:complete
MTDLFPDLNEHFEDNAGVFGAVAAMSIDRNQRKQLQTGQENQKLLKKQIAATEKQIAEAQKFNRIEEQRVQIERDRFRLEECRAKQDQIEKEQNKILAERQKNARLCMTAINKEIDILENSITTQI